MADPEAAAGPPKDPKDVSREAIATFLSNGIKMMQTDETRQRCRDPELQRPGQFLIELQRAEWDPLGVDRDIGCRALDQLQNNFPDDTELLTARNDFCQTAQRTFIRALEDRKPESLEGKAPLPRETIIEFFDACNTKMELPETRQDMLKYMTDTGKIPNQCIIDMQRDMLENLGFEKDHACAMLSNIGKDFPNDMELHKRFQHWQMCAQSTCQQVVHQHRQNGGELPAANWNHNFSGNPEFQRLWKKAQEEVEAMTPKERGLLLTEKQKKIEIFMQLPVEARQRQMERLKDEEKIEFMKVQMLAISVMKSQWGANGHAPNCPSHGHGQGHGDGHGHGHQGEEGATQMAPSAPPQQQMM